MNIKKNFAISLALGTVVIALVAVSFLNAGSNPLEVEPEFKLQLASSTR